MIFIFDCWSVATGVSDEVLSPSPPCAAVLLLLSLAGATAAADVEAMGGLSPSTGVVGDGGLPSTAAGGPVSVIE